VRGYKRADILTFGLRLALNPLVEVTWVDAEFHREAMNLLQSRLDETYSVCDAVSFLMMEQRNLTEALTTDHHFEQAGFRKLLR
jgi:predicted nucleic acid-binding protein